MMLQKHVVIPAQHEMGIPFHLLLLDCLAVRKVTNAVLIHEGSFPGHGRKTNLSGLNLRQQKALHSWVGRCFFEFPLLSSEFPWPR